MNEYREPETCDKCQGAGVYISCIDDMCAGSDRCIHGDGENICPVCHGEGVINYEQ